MQKRVGKCIKMQMEEVKESNEGKDWEENDSQ
jgi:hypothetical protein